MEEHCSVILGVFGRYEVLTYELQKKIEELKALDSAIEIVLALDGPRWRAAPMIQLLPLMLPSIKIMELEEPTHLPAKVFNAAIAQAEGDYLIFSTLFGTELPASVDAFQSFLKTEQKEKADVPLPMVLFRKPAVVREGDCYIEGALYGQCQVNDFLHIDEWCIHRSVWEKMGGFQESALLQEEFERYAALAFLRMSPAACAGTIPTQALSRSLRQFPFERRLVKNRDLARRFVLYCNAVSLPVRSHEECTRQFLRDICDEEQSAFARMEGKPLPEKQSTPRYKIFVIGGYWEYHHNQLGFYNYLENLYGTGFATFCSGLDVAVQSPELLGYDLVVFTRCRSKQSTHLMTYCKERGIPTLYMIDDNWFSVAKDYPELGKIFMPGNPNYDFFIDMLSLCKSTWVYNPLIRQDVLPYTANVQTFPISVCQHTFTADRPRQRSDEELYVGFSGSLRWSDTAFRALARLARRHKNVKLLLAGSLSPEQELLFRGLDTIRLPPASYAMYAQNMAALCPDVLVAPLEKNRTTQSKCANKYVEAGVVGAVCLCSRQEPYLSVVTEGETGCFVTQESDEGWYRGLEGLIGDLPRLRAMQQNVQRDVEQNYSVEKLLPLFRDKISKVIEQEVLEDD